jgi:hypothetical protein
MTRKILKNTPKTKKYLDSLPKVYGIFLWAKWGMFEFRWSGKCDKNGMPLVYDYYDANGTCDEYHLRPIDKCSSGAFLGWYKRWDRAKMVRDALNEVFEKKRNWLNEGEDI